MAAKKKLSKVRVHFKNPISNKSSSMRMTEDEIKWNKKNKTSSPYKKIVRER